MPRSPNTGCSATPSFFAWLEANWRDMFSGGASDASTPSRFAAAPRPAIVARDERESGERALLNLGHTFGHAFEAGAGFSDRLLHGEAVALGMALAFEFSARKGLIGEADAARALRASCGGRSADPSTDRCPAACRVSTP